MHFQLYKWNLKKQESSAFYLRFKSCVSLILCQPKNNLKYQHGNELKTESRIFVFTINMYQIEWNKIETIPNYAISLAFSLLKLNY